MRLLVAIANCADLCSLLVTDSHTLRAKAFLFRAVLQPEAGTQKGCTDAASAKCASFESDAPTVGEVNSEASRPKSLQRHTASVLAESLDELCKKEETLPTE